MNIKNILLKKLHRLHERNVVFYFDTKKFSKKTDIYIGKKQTIILMKLCILLLNPFIDEDDNNL